MGAVSEADVPTRDVVRGVFRVDPEPVAEFGRAISRTDPDPVLVGLRGMLRASLHAACRIKSSRQSTGPLVVKVTIGAAPRGWPDARMGAFAQMIAMALTADDERVVYRLHRGKAGEPGERGGIDLVERLSAKRLPHRGGAVEAVMDCVGGSSMLGVSGEARAERRRLEVELGIRETQSTNALIEEVLGLDPVRLVRPFGREAVASFDADPDGWGMTGLTGVVGDACDWILAGPTSRVHRLRTETDAEDELWPDARSANFAMLVAAALTYDRHPVRFLPAFAEGGDRERDLLSSARRLWGRPSERGFKRLAARCHDRSLHHDDYGCFGAATRMMRGAAQGVPAVARSSTPAWLASSMRMHDTRAWHE